MPVRTYVQYARHKVSVGKRDRAYESDSLLGRK